MKDLNVMSLKTLTKSNVWDIQENDVFRLIDATEKDADLKDNLQHYLAIMRSAFEMEEIKIDKPEIIKKYEDRGFKVSSIKMNTISKNKWAIKKRAIMRVTDLTYENIRHISASKLLEVIDRNFGGGWDSLSQSIRATGLKYWKLPKDCGLKLFSLRLNQNPKSQKSKSKSNPNI